MISRSHCWSADTDAAYWRHLIDVTRGAQSEAVASSGMLPRCVASGSTTDRESPVTTAVSPLDVTKKREKSRKLAPITLG